MTPRVLTVEIEMETDAPRELLGVQATRIVNALRSRGYHARLTQGVRVDVRKARKVTRRKTS